MDITKKIDVLLKDEIVTGDVESNTAKGCIDVVGGKCPEGYVYDRKKKVCVKINSEGFVYVYNKRKDKRIRISDDPEIIEKYKKKGFVVESSVVGGSYISGTTVNIIGSRQTRTGFTTKREILDLARKEPIEDEMDDPTDTNILGRKSLKFNKKTGSYEPELWS